MNTATINRQPLTIAQAEKDKESSLWVLNNSGGNGKQKGVINITIPEGNGQVNTIKMPVTSIPIDLTTQATKSSILSNPQFRRIVQGGMLKLVSGDHAAELLSSPEAQEEQRRLFSLGYDELPAVQHDAPEAVKDMLAENAGDIGGFAMNLAHNNDGNEDDLLVSLRNQLDTLNPGELKYIVNNSVHPKVKAEAAKHLVK
jgi:hypothetical protein